MPKILEIWCQLTKMYLTNFVLSRFWWIAILSFNVMEHIFIRSTSLSRFLSRLTLTLTILYGSVVN